MNSFIQQIVHRDGYSGTADFVPEREKNEQWSAIPSRNIVCAPLHHSQHPQDTSSYQKDQSVVSALEIRNVCFCTGDAQRVIDIPFLAVDVAEVFGFFGSHNSGMSVLIDLLSGRKMPTGGTITIIGRDIQRASCQSLFGVVPKNNLNSLGDDSTPYEHLLFQAKLIGMSKRLTAERIPQVLEYVGLTQYRSLRVGAFPVVMKRLLALARALLHDPQLLLLDEFTRDMGQQERESLWQLLHSLHEQGKTLVFTTSNWEEVDALCNQAAQLSREGYIDRVWKRIAGTTQSNVI